MKRTIFALVSLAVLLGSTAANAVTIYSDKTSFLNDTGATSITGAIPDEGNKGLTASLGAVDFVSQSGDIFFGTSGFSFSQWSTLIPGNDVAISGKESFDASINLASAATAFGFDIHEPTSAGTPPDTHNYSSFVDSTFTLSFFLDAAFVGTLDYAPPNDVLAFLGIADIGAFNRVEIRETIGNADNEYFGEFYATSVPEPAALALMAIGLAGIGLSRRKKAWGSINKQ